jgi:hypothetical protein
MKSSLYFYKRVRDPQPLAKWVSTTTRLYDLPPALVSSSNLITSSRT